MYTNLELMGFPSSQAAKIRIFCKISYRQLQQAYFLTIRTVWRTIDTSMYAMMMHGTAAICQSAIAAAESITNE